MNQVQESIDEYMNKTGQSWQYVMSGSQFFDSDFIFNELIPKALKENKKIVWKDEPSKGIGFMSYSLQDL